MRHVPGQITQVGFAGPLAALFFFGSLGSAQLSQAAADVDLTNLNLEQLLDLKVVGASKYEQTQREVPAAVSIITRDEIRAFGWRTLDEALASLPGVHTTYDRQYGYLGMRGFGLPGDYNTRVLVMIDGNRVNDAVYDSGPVDRAFPLDMDLVERIEFIPGPGGALYGQNAMLGVVNVITRDGSTVAGAELAGNVRSLQDLREGRATWGKKFENGFDVVLSASGMQADGQDLFFDYGLAGVSGVAKGLNDQHSEQFFTKVGYGAFFVDFEYGQRRTTDPTGAYMSDPLVPGQYQADGYTLAQAQYQDNLLNGTLQVTGRLFAGQERYRSELSYGTRFKFRTVGEWYGGELRGLYLGVPSHKLMLGAEWQDNYRADQDIIDVANPANNLRIASPGLRGGIYVQDDWRISDSLTAVLGVRVDHNEATGSKISPRAAIIWEAEPETTLKLLYGRAHRAPNAYERDYDDGVAQVANPSLSGESIDTLEAVADHRVAEDLLLRVTAYRWVMEHIVTLGIEPISGLAQYQSGGSVTAHGLEVSADKVWDWGGRLRGSVSWQHTRDEAGDRLVNSPDLLAKLNFSAPLPFAGLRVGYEMQYNGPRLTLNGSDADGYVLSNLRLSSGALVDGLEVGLTVRNLFDSSYVHPAADTNWQNALEQDGRSVALDALVRF